MSVGQRPTSPGSPASSPNPAGPPPGPAGSSGSKAGPALSAARPPSSTRAAVGAAPPVPSGARAAVGATPPVPSGARAAVGAAPPVPSGARAAVDAAPPPPEDGGGFELVSEIQARTSGLRLKPQPAGDMKQRLREGAIDTVLNAASILADTWDDFRRRDRFFKYKAAIIGAWVFLTITSVFVALPDSYFDAKNRLGAQLIEAGDKDRPVYMIRNNSSDPWREVTVVANGQYRTAVGTVEPNGGTLTFIPKQLKGNNDSAAPPDLKILDLQLRTDDGNAWLKKDGQAR